MVLADELAKQQRSISVAEFFEKNKHLLGFDSPTRGVITTIKEAVDNSLDACEEAQVLPDIFISIRKVSNEVFRIIVEDNGSGIPKDIIDKVFEPFFRGDISRNTEGAGLGLTLSKKIVENHNGTISIKSQVDVGTDVIISLPVSSH